MTAPLLLLLALPAARAPAGPQPAGTAEVESTWPQQSLAQEDPTAPRSANVPPRALSWEDCIALAAAGNPELAASARAVEASRASYLGSFNGLLPRLGLSNSYADSEGSSAGSQRWKAQGTIGIELWNMGELARIRAASAGLGRAQAGLRAASAGLRFDLRRAFAQILFAQLNGEVSTRIAEMRRRSAQLVLLRYDSGRESRGNMLRSKAQALQAEAELAQARRDLRTARRSLDRRLGLGDFSVLVATGALEARDPPDLPADARSLATAHPDVAAREATVRAARAGLSQARSVLWPSLSASYARSRLGAAEFPASRYDWSFTGLLSYPLFGGGPTAAYFAATAAKRGLEQAEQELRSARDQAALDIESAWSAYAGAAEQARVQAALLEAARQRNDEADVRYASGLLSYDNWEIIASDRVGSERRALQARLDAVVAQAAWDRAAGRTLGE